MSGSARIWVVDDEEPNVRLLERILERLGGASVRSTTDPREVQGWLVDGVPDLLLLDLRMPYADGFEVMRWVRERGTGAEYVPVVVLTADTERSTRMRALERGANDFLTKPLDATEVLLRARSLLETRTLHQALERQNERLEERVRERTRELEQALVAAEAAGRAKSQFVYNMNHELRTPTTAIYGAVKLVARMFATQLAEPAVRLLETASRNCERLLHLVQETLLYQSLRSGEMRAEMAPTRLADLLAATIEEFRERAEREGVALEEVIPPGSLPVETDEEKLRMILRRLIDNAVRFTRKGRIVVTVEVDPASGRPLWIDVTDSGIGISAEFIERSFDPFSQADESDAREHRGLGLGLAIARELGSLIGIRLDLESAPGLGTRARVLFPNPSPREHADGIA